jgi:hypothetical protein
VSLSTPSCFKTTEYRGKAKRSCGEWEERACKGAESDSSSSRDAGRLLSVILE